MLVEKVIELANTLCAFSIVLAPRKDGFLRFCADYRKYNADTVCDSYLIPRLDDCIESLSTQKFFQHSTTTPAIGRKIWTKTPRTILLTAGTTGYFGASRCLWTEKCLRDISTGYALYSFYSEVELSISILEQLSCVFTNVFAAYWISRHSFKVDEECRDHLEPEDISF